ncbi:hypothetical protein BDF14DRAFT_1743755 [Spinellus fusiger]|nr:hypothetical protein BDF14DRAFT_1743755 [Spinellus fusiger]
MASQLDRALDEAIRERRDTRKSDGRRQQDRVSTGGVRKRPAFGSRIVQSFVRTVQLRDSPSNHGRSVNQQWTHDLFEDSYTDGYSNENRSITSRLGGRSSVRSNESTELSIENLHYNVTEEDLQELFKIVGQVERTRIQFDRSGRSTGTATVRFTNSADTQKALQKYNNVELDGQAMKITIAPPPAPRQPRTGNANGRQGFRGHAGDRGDRPRGNARPRGRVQREGNRENNREGQRKTRSAVELDEEMEAYMKTTETINEDVDMTLG